MINICASRPGASCSRPAVYLLDFPKFSIVRLPPGGAHQPQLALAPGEGQEQVGGFPVHGVRPEGEVAAEVVQPRPEGGGGQLEDGGGVRAGPGHGGQWEWPLESPLTICKTARYLEQ